MSSDVQQDPTSSRPLKLTIQGIGHVPSFKNSKVIGRRHLTGKPVLLTKPQYRKWMQACTDSFVLQLLSKYRTTASGMQTVLYRRLWTVSSVPQDDSVQWIPEISVKVEKVEPGQEGAEILIERITASPFAPTP